MFKILSIFIICLQAIACQMLTSQLKYCKHQVVLTTNLNQLISQSRQQLVTIYRTSEFKLREIQANRNLNEALKKEELASIRRILKNQVANWRSTLNEKINFLERDMQNAIDLIFEKPIGNNFKK